MPRKRRTGRPRKHGGRRAGAGRPPIVPGGTQIAPFTLTAQHLRKIERWEERHGSESSSAALREMIDFADELDSRAR